MPRAAQELVQVTIKIPKDWIQETDDLAQAMSEPGNTRTRADVLRAAISIGKAALAAKHADALKEVRKTK